MPFPVAPTVGTTYTDGTGVVWEWTASGSWKRQVATGDFLSTVVSSFPLQGSGTAADPTTIADATATAKGVVELASFAEARDGAETAKVITPASMHEAQSRLFLGAWVDLTDATTAEITAISGDERIAFQQDDGSLRKITFADAGAEFIESGLANVSVGTAAEIAALTGVENLQVELASGDLRRIALQDLTDVITETGVQGLTDMSVAEAGALDTTEKLVVQLDDSSVKRGTFLQVAPSLFSAAVGQLADATTAEIAALSNSDKVIVELAGGGLRTAGLSDIAAAVTNGQPFPVAWGYVSGSTLLASYGVTSFDGGTDIVTLSNALPNTNYAVIVSGFVNGGMYATSRTTTTFEIRGNTSGGNDQDPTQFSFVVYA